eukprot:SAG25_NODE_859_length_5037_cov_2.778655_1_plen_37_part_10
MSANILYRRHCFLHSKLVHKLAPNGNYSNVRITFDNF